MDDLNERALSLLARWDARPLEQKSRADAQVFTELILCGDALVGEGFSTFAPRAPTVGVPGPQMAPFMDNEVEPRVDPGADPTVVPVVEPLAPKVPKSPTRFKTGGVDGMVIK